MCTNLLKYKMKNWLLYIFLCFFLSMITSIMNFPLIISTYATSSSRVHNIMIFKYIYFKTIILCTLLDEVAYVEIINRKFIIEVIILRQQHENI